MNRPAAHPAQAVQAPEGAPLIDNNLSEYAAPEKAAAARGHLDVLPSAQTSPRRLTAAFVSSARTLTETPAALHAGASALVSRRWLIIRNDSMTTRLRIGRLQANLQRDGLIIEPGAVMFLQLVPEDAITVYGCSEGTPVAAWIGEDVG